MPPIGEKKQLITQLQKDILLWEGFVPPVTGEAKGVGLGEVEGAFPNGVFPRGAVHEWVCPEMADKAATGGFIAGILGALMQNGGACLWVGTELRVFPPALKAFGVEPGRVIFADVKRERDILWVAGEALKCGGLAAVVAGVKELDFAQSRRLQLAVEQSRVTGFILRSGQQKVNATACAARWRVHSIASELPDGLPGVGFARWNVELLKVRNGMPGAWQLEWRDGRFVQVEQVQQAVMKHTEYTETPLIVGSGSYLVRGLQKTG